MAVGYQLAALVDHDEIAAVAGFRIGENLAWGRFLYVDDLVTRAERRSSGYGAALLNWLKDFAAKAHCHQLHLDSGAWRKDAHRFYERKGMTSLQKSNRLTTETTEITETKSLSEISCRTIYSSGGIGRGAAAPRPSIKRCIRGTVRRLFG